MKNASSQIKISPPFSIVLIVTLTACGLLLASTSSNATDRPDTPYTRSTRHATPTGLAHKTIRLTASDQGPYLTFADMLARPHPQLEQPRPVVIRPLAPLTYPDVLKAAPIAQRAYDEPTIAYLAKHEIRAGNRQKPLVALTFDCEAGTTSTRQILQTLRENNVHLTFFVLGKYAYMYPDIIREMVADGHELGNHSFFHPLFYDLVPVTATLEITMTEAAVAWAVGEYVPMRYFRFPYGGSSPFWRRLIAEWGYQSAFWGPDPRGWSPDKTPEDVVAYVRNTARNGDIFIFHCHAWNDVRALDEIIHLLREKGIEPTTLTEVLQDADRNVPAYAPPGASAP